MSENIPQNILVSIITVVYNGERHIADAVKSITSQTYPNIEHVVMDGASTDRTVAIVKELNPKAVIVSEPDSGALEALNKGLRMVKGDVIGLLNSDDYYADENVIQKVVDAFIADKSAKVLYGTMQMVDSADGKLILRKGRPVTSEDSGLNYLKAVLASDIAPVVTMFAMREVYDTVGPFSHEYSVIADGEYSIRMLKLYKPFFLNEVVIIMRSGGLASQNIFKAHKDVYKLLRRENIGFMAAFGYYLYCCVLTFFSRLFLGSGMRGIVLAYRRLKGQL
ncbi:MAG: glycosyltransferase [Nitrospirae bacterium]|nr:MAG: glycosyltransferase [Nitrospirota bacterium]